MGTHRIIPENNYICTECGIEKKVEHTGDFSTIIMNSGYYCRTCYSWYEVAYSDEEGVTESILKSESLEECWEYIQKECKNYHELICDLWKFSKSDGLPYPVEELIKVNIKHIYNE